MNDQSAKTNKIIAWHVGGQRFPFGPSDNNQDIIDRIIAAGVGKLVIKEGSPGTFLERYVEMPDIEYEYDDGRIEPPPPARTMRFVTSLNPDVPPPVPPAN